MKLGDVIDGRFEVVSYAGAGGMGQVFRARDQREGGDVAIKVLLPERAPEAARFEREARILSELKHPGIVRYVQSGITPSGERYIAMEWLPGSHLLSFLLRRLPTIEECLTMAARAAEALAFAHERGVVHRDLKPTNLFLVDVDPAKLTLLDFGIAWLGEETRVTMDGVFVGTPAYMAPEQARSEEEVDARADVFSLGCVLFECLTGRPAFSGERLMAILAKILVQDPPHVRELRPEVPKELDALVHQMMAKNPDHRPRDGAAVLQALSALGAQIAWPFSGRRPHEERRASLTGSERRALSVVLIGRPVRRGAARELGPIAGSDGALGAQAKLFGGSLEQLADGSAVVTFAGVGLASDQAAKAGRCALSLRALAEGRPIALATGRGELAGGIPLGEAIDRAVEMISELSSSRAGVEGAELAGVALDDVTAALLDARFDVRESEAGFTLVRERELSEGARMLLGKPTPCVGRDRELMNLETIFVECVEDSVAHAVVVTGQAGAGKSRVAYEFLRRAREISPSVEVWIGRGDSLRAGSAFGILGQVIRGACGIRDGESIDVRREKLAARVARSSPLTAPSARSRVTEFLGEICGVTFPDHGGAELQAARRDALLMIDQMRAAFEEFLRAACSDAPVILVLEDMHWGDLPTVRTVDAALRSLSTKPWMVLALARPEVDELFPRLWAERGAQEIRLKGLSTKASQRLARQVLGSRFSGNVIDRMVALSDGNAFYLEELIRAMVEQRGGVLPETVVAMVQSRLGALGDDLRRTLRAASVFGEVLWPGGVASLLGVGGELSSSVVLARLTELVEREVLVRRPESRFPGEDELVFRHALLREGAYSMLTEQDKVLGHRLAGEWLERLGETDPMVLAEHFERGKEPRRAGSYYGRAAELANQGGDTASAASRAERALDCGVPEEQRIELLGLICETYVWHPQLASTSGPYVEEVMRMSPPGSVPWARAALTRLMTALQRGRPDEFVATVGAIAKADPLPDAAGYLVWALGGGVFFWDRQGQIDEAERVLARAHSIVDPLGDSDPVASGWLHTMHAFRDAYAREEPASGLAHGRACEDCFQGIGKRRGVAVAQAYSGMNLWFLGAFEEAVRVLSGLVAADGDLGELSSVRPLCLTFALMDQGRLDDARACATAFTEGRYEQKSTADEGLGRWSLAEVLRRVGDLAQAEREARAAIEMLSILPLDSIAASATLAAILLAMGRHPEALVVAEGAMERYKTTRACGWFRGQFLRLVFAECLHAAGRLGEAGEVIAEARGRLLTNASKISDPDYRRSFLERVPENARTLELARAWVGLPGAQAVPAPGGVMNG